MADQPQQLHGYPVMCRRIEVGGHVYELLGPANYNTLVDDPRVEAKFARDEYMPYWAELWPACLLLADAITQWPATGSDGKLLTLLDLGCGLGITALVAVRRGFSVTASDYEPDALKFVADSARRNGLAVPTLECFDWRERYEGLSFDRIVGAELLYEIRNLRPIATFIKAHLRPDGLALLSDARRTTADEFATVAWECGLTVREEVGERAAEGDTPAVRGRLFYLQHAGA
ncbi:MAG: methyltransferase domain-containing protein [Phycisphaerae bacterium]|jgi:SAM-dependent methyltransferase